MITISELLICQLRTKKNDTDLFQRFPNALYDQSQIVIICLVAPKKDLASHFSLYIVLSMLDPILLIGNIEHRA